MQNGEHNPRTAGPGEAFQGCHTGSEMPHALSIGRENSSLREEQVKVLLLAYPKGLLRKVICPV